MGGQRPLLVLAAARGGSVEAKNKNWQKLCSVYKNMKSVLMTKHRNLENHSQSKLGYPKDWCAVSACWWQMP
ncbi:hypothetical protein TURU_069305 [Turdus rufiventris]|nr:hypothetical protein TURU_069305 [Turdus rufiventris]